MGESDVSFQGVQSNRSWFTIDAMSDPLMPLAALKKSGRWLNDHSRNVYSQTGEDGVIAKALELLPHRDRWCVEFGAWDGEHLSNTFNLVENDGYSVVLVEGDSTKFESLRNQYPYRDRAIFVGQFVGWTENDNLDRILEKTPVPADFDLLSIDVDGNDYHIWKAVQKFRPKLVLIEFNPASSNRFLFVQPASSKCNQGNSPAALNELAKSKGYELVCVIGTNLLFVDRQYYGAFGIPDNSLEIMRDEAAVTHLYLGFDGSLIMDGPASLYWHGGLPLKLKQPVPKFIRGYPPNYGRWQSLIFRLWRWLMALRRPH
jgi:hypothetical protein